jgi:hypothetical protein
MLRVISSASLGAILLALGLLGSTASAQSDCPNCPPLGSGLGLGQAAGPGGGLGAGHGFGLHGYGDAHRYGFDARGYYGRGMFGASDAGDCVYRHYGTPDLFRQYYVPNNCGGVAAGMYPAPIPVPPHVGHVYYTYEPFYPHEFMYPHHRTYYRYYDDGRGLTRAKVSWRR